VLNLKKINNLNLVPAPIYLQKALHIIMHAICYLFN